MGGTIVPTVTRRHLGLDLGGTNIKWVVLEREGGSQRVLTTGQVPTDTSRGEKSVVEQMTAIAQHACRDEGVVESIGVGVPGLYDPKAGSTRFMPNVPGNWAGVQVGAAISVATGVPARMINDARAFTLAEH